MARPSSAVVKSSATAPAATSERSRLVLPAGAVVEPLRCALCGELVAAAIIPPAPPLPFEFKTLIRPVARYVARRSPDLKRAVDCLLEGNIGGMIAALRASEHLGTLVPVVCSRCVAEPQTLVRSQNGDGDPS